MVSVPEGRKVPVAPGAAEVFEANRDMVECEEGKGLLCLRAEKVVRSFRHMPDYGGAQDDAKRPYQCRQTHVRRRVRIQHVESRIAFRPRWPRACGTGCNPYAPGV